MSGSTSGVIGVGLYTIPETALLLKRHFNTVRSWVRQGLAPSPVHLEFGETTILSFDDLISLMVVRRLRDEKVKLESVRRAEQYLRKEWGFQRPFATNRVLTACGSVFIALSQGGFTAVDRWGQEGIADVLKDIVKDVTYDAVTELANTWSIYPRVVLRPDIQFGQPCIARTRVTTRTIAELAAGGDSAEFLAKSYDLSEDDVRSAIHFEQEYALQRAA